MASIFVGISYKQESSWMNAQDLDKDNKESLFYTAVYFITTTLTTIGYGDISGAHENEKLLLLFYQFLGINVFAHI